ncbi:MAG: ExbD/TolR family protein [Candidatus Zixiibacteriota bacterium]
MKRREEALPSMEMTSMIDIIFQLMIFFIVTMSVMPAEQSAPKVEGTKQIPTPKDGDSEVSMVIQYHQAQGGYEFYVLQGNKNSAEFYQEISRKSYIPTNVLRNIGKLNQVYFTNESLKNLLREVSKNEPAILIRAPETIPYGEIVKLHSFMIEAGIGKIAWVKGSLFDLEAEIVQTKG